MRSLRPPFLLVLVLLIATSCKMTLRNIGGLAVRLEIPPGTYEQAVLDTAIRVLKDRVTYCSPDASLEILPGGKELYFEIPGFYDSALVTDFLLSKGEMYLYETYENAEMIPYLEKANDYLRERDYFGYRLGVNHPPDPYGDTVAKDTQDLFFLLLPALQPDGLVIPGAVIGHSVAADTSLVNRLLGHPEIRALFPPDLALGWNYRYEELYALVAMKVNSHGLHLTREVMEGATLGPNGFSINYRFREGYHTMLEKLTGMNINRSLALTLDSKVLFSARVQDTIMDGHLTYSGNTGYEENLAIVAISNAGRIDLPFTVRELRVLEPDRKGNGPIRPEDY